MSFKTLAILLSATAATLAIIFTAVVISDLTPDTPAAETVAETVEAAGLPESVETVAPSYELKVLPFESPREAHTTRRPLISPNLLGVLAGLVGVVCFVLLLRNLGSGFLDGFAEPLQQYPSPRVVTPSRVRVTPAITSEKCDYCDSRKSINEQCQSCGAN